MSKFSLSFRKIVFGFLVLWSLPVYSEECSEITVNCSQECAYNETRSQFERTCTAFDNKTGDIRWEKGTPCNPPGPFTCDSCTEVTDGNWAYKFAFYRHLKDGRGAKTNSAVCAYTGSIEHYNHPDCKVKTAIQICEEMRRKDSICK